MKVLPRSFLLLSLALSDVVESHYPVKSSKKPPKVSLNERTVSTYCGSTPHGILQPNLDFGTPSFLYPHTAYRSTCLELLFW